jgi:hypothetical protein
MRVSALLLLTALATSAPAHAQQTVQQAAPATPAQADLAPLVAARAGPLNDAEVRSILARTAKQRRDIRVSTRYGVSYFAWPKNVTPVAFEIDLSSGSPVVRAEKYTSAKKATYEVAFDAILPAAAQQAEILRARALRPK